MQISFEKIIIRVYALIVHEKKLLVSDEFWYDTPMTKFPGGGLEPGEGIHDCLVREIKEELGVEPEKTQHFFTYDQLLASDFIPSTQVIPVYYLVKLKRNDLLHTSDYRFDFKRFENGAISLRWIELDLLDENELSFIGDRMALKQLKKYLQTRFNDKL